MLSSLKIKEKPIKKDKIKHPKKKIIKQNIISF
jgi:hypothetical protein